MASVSERVIDIVADQLGVDKEKITPETSFVNDLGADSLDTVELVMELEEEFDINIPDDAAEKIQTVGQAIKFIEEAQSAFRLKVGSTAAALAPSCRNDLRFSIVLVSGCEIGATTLMIVPGDCAILCPKFQILQRTSD